MVEDNQPDMDEIYFFAYGSCMNRTSLATTLGHDVVGYFVGPAILVHYDLRFNYPSLNEPVCCANIEPCRGCEVEGALFRIPYRLLQYIDQREGVHLGRYCRQPVLVAQSGGQRVKAITYVGIATSDSEAAPSLRYRELLIQGWKECGVSKIYIDTILEKISHLPNRTEMR